MGQSQRGVRGYEIPADFLSVLKANPTTHEGCQTPPRSRHFEVYSSLISARREASLSQRMRAIIGKLAETLASPHSRL
ncbi:YdeI/OmpD-associated family protein [Lentibacter algarum]|uniref:YdeI/OmpD-associated family protein n=1 Tax=Lentibacter algarum TaxID=576131 RepID=UPI00339D4178